MTSTTLTEQIPFSTLRYALAVMGICFLPQLTIVPLWITLLIIGMIGYRLWGSYRLYTVPNKLARGLLVIICLILLVREYGTIVSPGFLITALLTFFWLKIIEVHTLRDLRVLTLGCFYVIFTSIIQHVELWIFLYTIIATLAALSLLVKLNNYSLSLSWLFQGGFRLSAIAIPISILMFFVFPRIADPLWRVPLPTNKQIGFSETLQLGSLSNALQDDTIVMRIAYPITATNKINLYWKGLVLSYYDGLRWQRTPTADPDFQLLPSLPEHDPGDYEVMLEPLQKMWLFYQDIPIAARPSLRFSANTGLTRADQQVIYHRFAYTVRTAPNPPLSNLSPLVLQQNIQLPPYSNPRLRRWALEQFAAVGKNHNEFIQLIAKTIQNEAFWYRLNIKEAPRTFNQLDRFWFETREGYCEHYAAAVTYLLRAVGIPAHVIMGYYGGEWNPLAQYFMIRQKDAHAWLEFWEEGRGWIALDPTAFISANRIDPAIKEAAERRNANRLWSWEQYQFSAPWLAHTRIYLESLRYFWERWLLFYNQNQQETLIQHLGLGEWNSTYLLQAWIGIVLALLFGAAFYYYWQEFRWVPAYQREYRRLQRILARMQINTHPPATFLQQCESLAKKKPTLAPLLEKNLAEYEKLRLKQHIHKKEQYRSLKILFKSLRKKISTTSP